MIRSASSKPKFDVVAVHESDGADCAGVIVGEHALAVEGGGDRDVEGLGEAGDSGLSGGPGRAVPGEQDRAVCGPQQLCRAGDLGRRGCLGSDHVAAQGRQGGIARGLVDVFGDREVDRAGAFGLGGLERFADHLRDRARPGHGRRPFGDRCEHADEVDELVGFLVVAVLPHLRGDRHHRRAVGKRVGDAELQVDCSWP